MNASEQAPTTESDSPVALCQSCDRCRARKTRCDGERPCHGCISKYMKNHKVSSVEGVPLQDFECLYSPAKRRGPVPGRSQNRKHKAPTATISTTTTSSNTEQQQLYATLMAHHQQQQQLEPSSWPLSHNDDGFRNDDTNSNTSTLIHALDHGHEQHRAARRVRTEHTSSIQQKKSPDTIAAHVHLLDRSSAEGNRLRAYFRLSVDELFTLPPIPSNEEFMVLLNGTTTSTTTSTSSMALSKAYQHALLASRFCEIALGALVHNEVPLAIELCNAVVHCLRECAGSSNTTDAAAYLYEVSRSYFLLGTFRAFRGDMERYFKYRRVCLAHLVQNEDPKHEMLLAAISFLDSWAYMIYNADESDLPEVDMPMPSSTADASNFYCVVTDPKNQMWIQGAPPVYLNNEAPLPARSLDALACAVRQCCDQANNRFAEIHKEVKVDDQVTTTIPRDSIETATRTAVMASENELCSRNMVLSAFTLLQQHEASASAPEKNQGHHLIICAMDAFLENGDEDGSGGFTDSQIQSLLSVCNIVIENPYLLYHAGPTYHMVSNSAVLICHLLNGMHATHYGSESHPNREMETAVFDEILDTFLAIRKLLNIHRRKLPVKLRCHGIPRPNVLHNATANGGDRPFIDLGNTLMCSCRGCQGFVLMACSPCVAAERALAATRKQEAELEQETLDLDQDLYDFGSDFDLDDDALLNMLSRIITT